MQSVSLNLDPGVLKTIKSRAMAANVPVAKILRDAVDLYLKEDEKRAAKLRVLECLKEKPFGGMSQWDKHHEERTGADACRR
ncbi:MAG: hypothetical protein HZA20_13670 [Nitrospirae bacterium]|nr:hypothetical protein [Nitrospirota bacterium]